MKTNEIVLYDVIASLSGKSFKPSSLAKKTKLPLNIIAEPGVIAKIGRNKGQSHEFGSASIKIAQSLKDATFEEKLEWILTELETYKEEINKSHVEEIALNINIGYRDQCSLLLDNKYLERISNLNASIEFDAYKYSDANIQYLEDLSETTKSLLVKQLADLTAKPELGLFYVADLSEAAKTILILFSDATLKTESGLSYNDLSELLQQKIKSYTEIDFPMLLNSIKHKE